ncbi:MAG TPA: hypothetical protein VG456_00190 [Candidatus Sulfopaludibacter sp.]|jgi:hypothetical protein|nr:hypothetical protein [Candidatus Sulfopaludibacter sp.]
MKNFLTVTVLAIASLSIAAASTKSYEIILNTASQAGKTELRAGHYLLKTNGAFVEFLNIDNGHSTMVPVKIGAAASKSNVTAVETKTENGVSQIQSIELRDSTTKLEF